VHLLHLLQALSWRLLVQNTVLVSRDLIILRSRLTITSQPQVPLSNCDELRGGEHTTVLPENKEHLETYFGDREYLPAIRLIIDSIYTHTLDYHGEGSAEGNERLHAFEQSAWPPRLKQ